MQKNAVVIFTLFCAMHSICSQNLVNNPNFTELDSCPYTFDQIHFATGWQTDNDQTPDLYDSCATGGFYEIPADYSCVDLIPQRDNGFVGIVIYGNLPGGNSIREIISTPLIQALPVNVDIYCSIAVSPIPICIFEDQFSFSCYADGIGMAITYSDFTEEIVVTADGIVNNAGTWKTLSGLICMLTMLLSPLLTCFLIHLSYVIQIGPIFRVWNFIIYLFPGMMV